MLDYAALAAVFAVVTVAVPSMAAELVGGTVGLALGHAFEAAYTAQTIARIVNPITCGLKKVSDGVAGLRSGKGTGDVAANSPRFRHTRSAPAPEQLPRPRQMQRPRCSIHSTDSPQATTTADQTARAHRPAVRRYRPHQMMVQEAGEPRSNISLADRGSIRRTSPSMSPDSKTATARAFHKFCRRCARQCGDKEHWAAKFL